MRLRVLGVIGLSALAGCVSPTSEQMASLAAKGYYEHLIRGEYESFLEGVDVPDYPAVHEEAGLPSYYDQLLDNYRQFMAQQQSAHGGIREVRIVRAKMDSIQHYTNVFLTLCFGDSTNEEIVVPMVNRGGRWCMK